MKNNSHILKFCFLMILLFVIACNPTIYRPKQNVSLIKGEVSNTEGDDIAPIQQKFAEEILYDSLDRRANDFKVKASSKFIEDLFQEELESGDRFRKRIIKNLTNNVESIYFIDTNRGFASFSHPPSPEFLMGQNLPFDKSELISDNSGGTDIFYFAPSKYDNNSIRFQNFPYLNSPFWDSHPTAVLQKDKNNNPVILIIFSSDREQPFSKAIDLNGDTIYGGSTDLYYAFARLESSVNSDANNLKNYKFDKVKKLEGANTPNFSEGSPFVFCDCCSPTLFFSSNRNNKNRFDFDIYSVKLMIDYDNFTVETAGLPEIIDEKSMTTDSLTFRINTFADERFPFIPFPHSVQDSNYIYFSSDRNKKIFKNCGCEDGRDRTENFGEYDIYKYNLPEKYKCPKTEKPPKPEPKKDTIYSPELYADIVIINAQNPKEKLRDSKLLLLSEDGKEIILNSDTNRIFTQLDFGKKYSVRGGSTYNTMNCEESNDIIFSGYSMPKLNIYEMDADSSTKMEVLTSFTMKLTDFVKLDKEKTSFKDGKILVKGHQLNSKIKTVEKAINARIENDIVYYDKQFTHTNYWNKIDIRPDLAYYTEKNNDPTVLNLKVPSVRTLNEELFYEEPQSNKKIIIYDTIYLIPNYIIKPPCYCEFSGNLTSFQQNVPYFQTGFWEVNTLKNYRRDIQKLASGRLSDARWVELHRHNQYFGEGKFGRIRRHIEYENYARTVDSNLSKMAEMIVNSIIPAFKVIDSINPGEKLIISLDAWSDRRPVQRGWYIGDEINYVEGSLEENKYDFDIDFRKVNIKDKSSLNMNNDTLSRLRAYFGYKELLNKLLDTAKYGKGFYDYYKANLVLMPDNDNLTSINVNKPFSLKSIEELIYKSKIIILAKGNYFDPTNFKIPQYIRDVDSSLFMLDTIRRIDLRINTLEYKAGKLIKSPCCNPNLPCIDYEAIINDRKSPAIIEKKKKK